VDREALLAEENLPPFIGVYLADAEAFPAAAS
jgi:hypothetical protein